MFLSLDYKMVLVVSLNMVRRIALFVIGGSDE